MKRVNVTKTFMPPIDLYQKFVEKIWQAGQLTNQGPLLHEFEAKVKEYLDVKDFQFVANGTLALQIALRALEIPKGEIITTPFSYVATTSAILWEGYVPVFVDIDKDTYCIDATKIEKAITPKTRAIMAVHVFGRPCNIEAINQIAKKHKLKVIYDAAHAFGVKYKGKSLLDYGDISTCSFHATKLFHTIEGGGVIARDPAVSQKVELMKRFGHEGDEHIQLGINAKASEFQAAMGLCNLNYIDELIDERKRLSRLYDRELPKGYKRPVMPKDTDYNYSYYPVLCESEEALLAMLQKLNAVNIFPRRYFYPSLNTLPYVQTSSACPVSEDIASRIMCLPLYPGLEDSTIKQICDIMTK